MSKISKLKLKHSINIYKNYVKDFPKNERKPIVVLLKNAYIKKISNILTLDDDDKPVAYTIAVNCGKHNCILVDYLATIGNIRSKGYGSEFIELLKEYYSDKAGIFVEIERCGLGKSEKENIQRKRRLAFYEKNGFEMTNIDLNLFGVDMNILYLPIKKPMPKNVFNVMTEIYNDVFGRAKSARFIKMSTIDKK